MFDERKPLEADQPLDELDEDALPKMVVYGVLGALICAIGLAGTGLVLYEALTFDATAFPGVPGPSVLGAVGLCVTTWVAIALVLRGFWMAIQGARGRDTGHFMTERVGWFMAIGWGVPLAVVVAMSFSWEGVVEQPFVSGVVALVALFLIRAPMVGRALDRQ